MLRGTMQNDLQIVWNRFLLQGSGQTMKGKRR